MSLLSTNSKQLQIQFVNSQKSKIVWGKKNKKSKNALPYHNRDNPPFRQTCVQSDRGKLSNSFTDAEIQCCWEFVK